ncbi:DUF2635 domain-containing protein [Commensalibacter oyaizuii]|uniref:DUF2635 domain-containing protein n=1 Tax=Commensalibacter oyaizuii TaxID=3043873 RepID=A0ABT6Q3D1_9PROT|nr:DUF2635 domain-containing protein [Commensalibacter sp. TBRC 16381]MDI2091621.1 DUF2635 domain-containing protein [Commensalibacter sp. TBRC 16381]
MFVKPAPGRKVRWPGAMRLLSEQGEEVPQDFYWARLLNTGDIVKVEENTFELKKSLTTGIKKESKDG